MPGSADVPSAIVAAGHWSGLRPLRAGGTPQGEILPRLSYQINFNPILISRPVPSTSS
jgi:hypothetical protein